MKRFAVRNVKVVWGSEWRIFDHLKNVYLDGVYGHPYFAQKALQEMENHDEQITVEKRFVTRRVNRHWAVIDKKTNEIIREHFTRNYALIDAANMEREAR